MTPSTLDRKYGWKPQLPDHRDRLFMPRMTEDPLPLSMDMRAAFPVAYDQGQLGSCTGNAISGAVEYDLIRQKLPSFTPSRLFVYYNERALEGTIAQDNGADIRDGIKTINTIGVCPETLWPYDIAQFAVDPPAACYLAAAKSKSLSYESVTQDLLSLQICLASGLPVVFGFTVYESFESATVAKSGLMPMPAASEGMLGGHAVLCVGYNYGTETVSGIPANHFVVRNSWGENWGDKGYFYMPFEYLTNPNLASDFWAIQVME